jgi:hypothetical protein
MDIFNHLTGRLCCGCLAIAVKVELFCIRYGSSSPQLHMFKRVPQSTFEPQLQAPIIDCVGGRCGGYGDRQYSTVQYGYLLLPRKTKLTSSDRPHDAHNSLV